MLTTSFNSTIRLYWSFIRVAFLKMLAYRARYYTGILTYLLFVSIHYFIWNAVYQGREGLRIGGYLLSEMITYVMIGWIARSAYFSDVDYEIDDLVRTGQIGAQLSRPVDFQLMIIAQAFGETIFRAIYFTLPIAIVVLSVYHVAPPAGVSSFLMFLLSVAGAFLVLVNLNFLIGLLSFWLRSIQGIMRAKYFLIQLCSGLLLPFSFFPDWAQTILGVLPFKAISYIPLQFYLGKLRGVEALEAFAVVLFWVVLLFSAGRFFWKRAFTKLTIQGG